MSPFIRLGPLFLLAACTSPDGDRATGMDNLAPVRTDSGGVTILTHAVGALDQAPLLVFAPTPLAVIVGSIDDIEADISTIRPILFLSDGRLVGIDNQRQVIIVFGADGTTRQEFGRQGAGPGEFGRLGSIVPGNGDTLLVADYANNRVSMFDPKSGALGEFPLSAPREAGGTNPIGMVGRKILLRGWNQSSGSDTPPGIKGVLFDPASGLARRIFTTGPEERPDDGPREIMVSGGAVLAVRALSIPALTTIPTAFGWQGETVVADGNRYRFAWWDTTGAMRQELRVDVPREPVTPSIWEAHLSARIAQLTGASTTLGGGATISFGSGGGTPDTANLRRFLAAESHADSLPLFERTQVGPGGTLWVVDYPVPGRAGWAATAFASDGTIRGRIVADSGEAPLAFGDDRAVFRREDDLGIATLTVRKLAER